LLVAEAVLAESAPLAVVDPAAGGKGIWRSCLIEADVEGSSGFYPAEVLVRDGADAFPAGTHVYLDHPTEREDEERPERSVRDLAGVLLDDAAFEESEDGRGLFARIQFIEELRSRVHDLAKHIGLSIRAAGEVEETSSGRIVRRISQGLSVDLVTRAGAGGRLVTMTESSKADSPPGQDKETETATKTDNTIPSSSGTGALVSEVAAMREAFSDRVDQLVIEVARMNSQLKEAQRANQKLVEENRKTAENLEFLKERQEKADQAIAEAENTGQALGTLIESGLPIASLTRLARGYHPGQDLHEAIKLERDYLKRVLRESARTDLSTTETSGLGLTESIGGSDLSTMSTEDFSEMDDVLAGKKLF
jgi:hypothetical protein